MPLLETLPHSLQNAEIPQSFSSRKRAQETVDGVFNENLSIPELELQKLEGIHELLSHPNLQKLISEGKITFGMIKPKASEGVGLPEDDELAAQAVLDEIGENVVFDLPFKFTKKTAGEFYGHLKEQFKDKPEIYEEVIDFTTSSGLTALLIYKKDAGRTFGLGEGQLFADRSKLLPNGKLYIGDSEHQLSHNEVAFLKAGKPIVKDITQMSEEEMNEFKGRRKYFIENGEVKVKIENAVSWWRDKMGDTRPENARKNNPNSIRARHSAELPNNIVHGSDSIESARREIRLLDNAVVDLIEKSES